MDKFAIIAVISFCFILFEASAVPIGPACQVELNTYIDNQQKENPPLGARKPVCDDSGRYAPKQCSGSQCYCVMRNGTQIEGFTANVWEASGQTCQCARDQVEYSSSGLLGKQFYCTSDGSYQKYKCFGSVCYCADSDGNQVGSASAFIGQVESLKC